MAVEVDPSSPELPAFLQVKSDVSARIASGKLLPGQRLRDERSLAREYQVSRNTIRRALELLAEENAIERIQGDGTYVRGPDAKKTNVAVIFYGWEMPADEYVLFILSLLGRQLAADGSEMLFRPCLSEPALAETMGQLNGRKDLRGGIILSANTPDEIERIGDLAEFPLVHLGDMCVPDRRRVILNQVAGSTHDSGVALAQRLIEHGCRRLAILSTDDHVVWNAEFVAAFRDTCKRTPGCSTSVHCVYETPEEVTVKPPDAFRLFSWADDLVTRWQRDGLAPDGIVAIPLWVMPVVVQTFEKAGTDAADMPQFGVPVARGIPFQVDRPDLRVVLVRAEYDGMIRRTLERLEELCANESQPRLEIMSPELTIEEFGYDR